MSKILVTGAAGFLGGRVAQALTNDGWQVRAFVRGRTGWTDAPAAIEIVQGDVTDRATFVRAAEGCEVIVHAAALVRTWDADPARFDRVNVGGLRNAADAARVNGARLVYLSSFIALGPTDGFIANEDAPIPTTPPHNDYERTKREADRVAREFGAQGLPIVRLYPGVVFGPGRRTSGNHVVGLLVQHAAGRIPGLLGGGRVRQCFAFVDDVVRGVTSAVERANSGTAYLLGGENRTVRELFEAFERATGIRPPRLWIPFALASLVGRVARWRADRWGTEPELTDQVVGIYRHEWCYASDRAERELGYRITPFDQAVQRTAAWLRERGEIRGA